jgi:uncharacterized repeat protein (TIGR04138 family)
MSNTVKLSEIASQHGTYTAEAYALVAEGLHHSAELTGKTGKTGDARHLTAQELVAGVLHLAAERFGLLAAKVLGHWGVLRSEDLGNITYHLIEAGVFGQATNDRQGDFDHGPVFETTIRELVTRQLEEIRRA